MYRYRMEHTIVRMAKVLDVSESGYHKWRKGQDEKTLREIENIEIEDKVEEIYFESGCVFGIRKVTKVLNQQWPVPVNHKRVERIMKEKGLFSKTHKKYVVTTDSSKTESPAENILDRNFEATEPGTRLVSDTTYLPNNEGSLYAAVILDLHGKMPIGLAISTNNDKNLTIDCLNDALSRVKLKDQCILHSDRGSTYSSKEYQELMKENNIVCSMSRKGNCWDNAAMESFFGKMKTEWLNKKCRTRKEAILRVYEYVWDFYPKKRPHASLNYKTPFEVYYGTI